MKVGKSAACAGLGLGWEKKIQIFILNVLESQVSIRQHSGRVQRKEDLAGTGLNRGPVRERAAHL